MSQAALPFAARAATAGAGAPKVTSSLAPEPVRFRQGPVITFVFTPYARREAGRWQTLYGPTPRQAIERLIGLLDRPPRDLQVEDLPERGTCMVFAETPLETRRPVAFVEGLTASEMNPLLEIMERWAC